ncbi:MAG: hypothetical protein R3F02_18775 [Thiolinea sp.]
MALTNDQKLEKVWEWYNNNADTSVGKQFYEETIPRASEVHGAEVFGELIPPTPPAASAGVVKKFWPAVEGGDGWLPLTVDRSVPGNKTWVALPEHSDNWSSGSADTSQVLSGFISPKYGKQYLVKVFDGNDNEIPQLDSSDWTFDYSAGVLVFNGANRSETGNSAADSIKIKVYQYVGNTLLDVISSASGRLILKGNLIGTKDGVNKQFNLPASVDSGVYYEIRLSGVPLVATDYTITGGTQVELIEAPESYQGLDIVYYPTS